MTKFKTEPKNWFSGKIVNVINKNKLTISWSKLIFSNYVTNKITELELKKNYTDYHLIKWWNSINMDSHIEYCIGIVMFNDNSWIEFYDKSETEYGGNYRKLPDYNKFKLNEEYDDLFDENTIKIQQL